MEGEREQEKEERGEMIEAKPTFPISLTNAHTNLDSIFVGIPILKILNMRIWRRYKKLNFFCKIRRQDIALNLQKFAYKTVKINMCLHV